MSENFRLYFSNENCKHTENCGCKFIVKGISPALAGFVWEGDGGPMSHQYQCASEAINRFDETSKLDIPPVESEEMYFRARVPLNSTMTPIDAPIDVQPSYPQSVILCEPMVSVKEALRMSDWRYFKKRFKYMNITYSDMRECWGESDHAPSLFNLALRHESAYWWACGKTNGRPHILSCMEDIFPSKLADAILTTAREELGDRPAIPLKNLSEALDKMYRKMRVDRSFKKKAIFSLQPLYNMYLGASNGERQGPSYTIPESINNPYPIHVSIRGKKIDTFEQDIAAILHYLRTGIEPQVTWVEPPKDETRIVNDESQWDDEAWAKQVRKLRVFNIPNSIFILLERLVSLERMYRERGWVIRVGHKHSRGGGDSLARCLGIDLTNCWKKIIVEGDAKLFDQSVLELFVNLYYSSMLIYYDPNSPDMPFFEKVTKFLLRNIIQRITRVFGRLWAIVKGGVPSGAFNTSHMDSWVEALYFFLFCVHVIITAPENLQEHLEDVFEKLIFFIDYGDDFLYNKSEDRDAAHYFSGTAFAKFMDEYFNVKIRDLKDGVPFCSRTKDGRITEWGATFLKHQHVLNPVQGNGQAIFLPYRESREYMIRAVYGRVTRLRDPIDVMLSIVGHAYGTYASNRDAYDRLYLLYSELLQKIPNCDLVNLREHMLSRFSTDDLKKIRQAGLTPENLVSGFPTWETLVAKNVVDWEYQDISRGAEDLRWQYDMSNGLEGEWLDLD